MVFVKNLVELVGHCSLNGTNPPYVLYKMFIHFRFLTLPLCLSDITPRLDTMDITIGTSVSNCTFA